MDDQDFLDLSSRQEHLMREMNAYLKAIDITDSPGDNSAATMKVTNLQNKTLSSRLRVPPLATITSSSSSSSSSSGTADSTTKDNSTTNDNTEVEKKKRQGRRRSLTNHLNSIDEHNRSTNGSKISADYYNHIYNEGQKVIYTNSEGSCLAVITKVHYDDEMQPYYTIEIEGREKQTDNNHLSRFDNESEYEYFNEAQTTTSSQFEDDSLVAMAKRMDDSQTIVSDPSLICGTKEKTLLTLPNLPNITKKLGINKGKEPIPRSPTLDSSLPSADEDDNRSICSSDSSSSASVEVFDYNGMTREQVMSMKKGRDSPIDAPSGNKEGRRSRGESRKNGEKTHHSRRHHRSSTGERRKSSSRHRSSSRSRRRKKDRKRRQHKHDDDDESMHGIGFNTRVNKPDMDGRRQTAQDERPIHQPHSRRQHRHHNNHTKNQIDDDSSGSDEHSTYDSDDCTQIFYESTDDEWCSADSKEELVAIGTSVTDAVNNLNKKRGVKSLFGLR